MNSVSDKGVEEYLTECRDQLDIVGADLLAIEKSGAKIDGELLEDAFRAVRSVKEGAALFELFKIGELAHQVERAFRLIRSRELAPTPARIGILLSATDRLYEMIENADSSNQANTTEVMASLATLMPADPSQGSGGGSAPHLRLLVVEDEFASRFMLQTFLSRYGDCHVAVNGSEAVEAVRSMLEQGQRYDLICMDIMMPGMDGREAVKQIRALEATAGIPQSEGVKIVMTTAVDHIKEVFKCFKELCDAYLVKPIDLSQLLSMMQEYKLVQ